MRYGLPAVALIGATTLGGCSEGVLDPKGPIAAAERLILFNSLGIMLAIRGNHDGVISPEQAILRCRIGCRM